MNGSVRKADSQRGILHWVAWIRVDRELGPDCLGPAFARCSVLFFSPVTSACERTEEGGGTEQQHCVAAALFSLLLRCGGGFDNESFFPDNLQMIPTF